MGAGSNEVLRTRFLALFALYNLHYGLRHGAFSVADVDGALRGFLREGRLSHLNQYCTRRFSHVCDMHFPINFFPVV